MDAVNAVQATSERAKRTRRVRVRFQEQELAAVRAAAEARGEYVAQFVRHTSVAAARAVERPGSG